MLGTVFRIIAPAVTQAGVIVFSITEGDQVIIPIKFAMGNHHIHNPGTQFRGQKTRFIGQLDLEQMNFAEIKGLFGIKLIVVNVLI